MFSKNIFSETLAAPLISSFPDPVHRDAILTTGMDIDKCPWRHLERREDCVRHCLFPDNYNPRVIQDSWRKVTRDDYDSIGAFAADKCAGYKPTKPPQQKLLH